MAPNATRRSRFSTMATMVCQSKAMISWVCARLLRSLSRFLETSSPRRRERMPAWLRRELVVHNDLGFIGELQAIQQAGILAAALPLSLQLACFLQAGGGEVARPALIAEVSVDEVQETHLEHGDHAEQPHAHRRVLQVGARDQTGHRAQRAHEKAREAIQLEHHLRDRRRIGNQGVFVEGMQIIAADATAQVLVLQVAADKAILAHASHGVTPEEHAVMRLRGGRRGVEGGQRLGDIARRQAAQKGFVDVVVGCVHRGLLYQQERCASIIMIFRGDLMLHELNQDEYHKAGVIFDRLPRTAVAGTLAGLTPGRVFVDDAQEAQRGIHLERLPLLLPGRRPGERAVPAGTASLLDSELLPQARGSHDPSVARIPILQNGSMHSMVV